MSQIALPLDVTPSPETGGYIVTDANSGVHYQLSDWENWPHGTAILIGPEAAGKSTMARQFELESGGYCIDKAEASEDDVIFHLWNRANEELKPLLLTSSYPVADWGIILPDLKSRLAASLLIEIGPPDEAMIEGLLQKYFVIRGLSISQDALAYLSKRIERSYGFVPWLARKMDNLAIERKKPITLAIARAALTKEASAEEAPDQNNSGGR